MPGVLAGDGFHRLGQALVGVCQQEWPRMFALQSMTHEGEIGKDALYRKGDDGR